jgi:hypothetical protein
MYLYDKVFLGDRHVAKDLSFLISNQITRVINCTPDLKCHFEFQEGIFLNLENETPSPELFDSSKSVQYNTIGLGDTDLFGLQLDPTPTQYVSSISNTSPPPITRKNMVEIRIEYMRIPLHDSSEENILKYFGKAIEFIESAPFQVLIHCREAKSRSIVVALAYLMKSHKMSLKSSYELVCKACEPRINDGFKVQLMEFELQLYNMNTLDFLCSRREMKKLLYFYESPLSDQENSPPKKKKYIQKTIPEMLVEKYHSPPKKEIKPRILIPEDLEMVNTPIRPINVNVGQDLNNRSNWSSAKQKAFGKKTSNPNEYYYRFKEDGDDHDTGAWSKEEKELFMSLLPKLDKKNPGWGTFSKQIPKRVGYQCASFYRSLIAKGEIVDENYEMDKHGKWIHKK